MPTDLNPISETSAVILPATGTADSVSAAVPFGVYTGSVAFCTGAAKQVDYVYRKLGGDVVDIELTADNVYSAYEEAVLEYSYIVNLHQGKNTLPNALGNQTASFDSFGNITSGPSGANLRYPRFQIATTRQIGDAMSTLGGYGGTIRQYSASFGPKVNVQDYDLQTIINSASNSGVDDAGTKVDYSGSVGNNRVIITRVFYRSPRAMWRFYGYYGGIGVVGNYSTYGQFADDSTFEIIPTWQNKLQAIMYEDSITTRTSNYAYELKDNMLRLFPTPSYWGLQGDLDRIWVQFYVDNKDVWSINSNYDDGREGVNNINTLPFDNILYENINAIGKQWVRKYALALCKEMLGQIRGKFTTMPIPGESVTLNHAELLSQAKEEQSSLRDKLMEILDTMTYPELAKTEAEMTEAATNSFKGTPLPIFVG